LIVRTAALQLLEMFKESTRKLGPYVLLELLLPGGTLFALALFVFTRKESLATQAKRAGAAVGRVLTDVRDRLARAAGIVLPDECARRRAGVRFGLHRRYSGACARARIDRGWGSSWRLPSSIAVRCPASPPRA
jgi:hypothetical protein